MQTSSYRRWPRLGSNLNELWVLHVFCQTSTLTSTTSSTTTTTTTKLTTLTWVQYLLAFALDACFFAFSCSSTLSIARAQCHSTSRAICARTGLSCDNYHTIWYHTCMVHITKQQCWHDFTTNTQNKLIESFKLGVAYRMTFEMKEKGARRHSFHSWLN